MKKLILSGLLIASTLFVQAQKTENSSQKTSDDGKNEIKINLFSSILALPEINYERLLEDNMGVGLALGFGLGNDDDFSDYRFLAIPHYRVYFGRKRAAGFFIEGNAALANVRDQYTLYYNSTNNTYYTSNNSSTNFNFGLGAAVGAKFLTRNGFLGEIFGGAGRFLGDNRSLEAYPRVGVTIGKRF
jgi:hypothetical protein